MYVLLHIAVTCTYYVDCIYMNACMLAPLLYTRIYMLPQFFWVGSIYFARGNTFVYYKLFVFTHSCLSKHFFSYRKPHVPCPKSPVVCQKSPIFRSCLSTAHVCQNRKHVLSIHWSARCKRPREGFPLLGSLKLLVSFAEYRHIYRALALNGAIWGGYDQ